MRSLRQQILIALIASLVLMSVSFILILGFHMRERATSAAIIKAQSDLATCTEIINLKYPGDWHTENGALFKGSTDISLQNDWVDYLSALTGDTVTIFLNDTRIATTVRSENGARAIGTKVSDTVAQKVLKNGEVYLGEANVVGQIYQTAYEPIRDTHGNILGMFYVGISRSYMQEMITNSLWETAILGMGITLIIGIFAWLLIERAIIRPLRNITLGTRDLATGHITEKVTISGPKEIGELASAFNQMIERLENVTKGLEDRAVLPREDHEVVENHLDELGAGKSNLASMLEIKKQIGAELEIESEAKPESEAELSSRTGTKDNFLEHQELSELVLPKGLNKATLLQITDFLRQQYDFVSAEDVAEGVKLTRVTVRRYLEFLEQEGILTSKLKYGTVGRPVRMWCNNITLIE